MRGRCALVYGAPRSNRTVVMSRRGCAGNAWSRMRSPMHCCISASVGSVTTVTPVARPFWIAAHTSTAIVAGTPHTFRNTPRESSGFNASTLMSGFRPERAAAATAAERAASQLGGGAGEGLPPALGAAGGGGSSCAAMGSGEAIVTSGAGAGDGGEQATASASRGGISNRGVAMVMRVDARAIARRVGKRCAWGRRARAPPRSRPP